MTTSADASLWLDTAPPTDYAPLDAETEVDVAVIGGGITGLTTALLLKRSGFRVAVLEARRVGSGVTGCTTAKVSALQQTLLQTIRRHHGDDGAADYARASRDAVELVATFAREEQIECDIERHPALTYAATEDERPEIDAEYEAAQAAGLPVTPARRACPAGAPRPPRRPALPDGGRGASRPPDPAASGALRAGARPRRPRPRQRRVRAHPGDERRRAARAHRPRHRQRAPRRRRGALPAARPRAVLRPSGGAAVVLHRRARPRRRAALDGDLRGEPHTL